MAINVGAHNPTKIAVIFEFSGEIKVIKLDQILIDNSTDINDR